MEIRNTTDTQATIAFGLGIVRAGGDRHAKSDRTASPVSISRGHHTYRKADRSLDGNGIAVRGEVLVDEKIGPRLWAAVVVDCGAALLH